MSYKIGRDVIGRPEKLGSPSASFAMVRTSDDSTEKVRRYLEVARAAALSKSPFIYSIISGLEIRATDEVPIAAVSKHGVLYINPKGLMEVAREPKEAVSILLHEALHVGLGHFQRLTGPNYDPQIANIAEDAVVNDILEESGFLLDLPIYKEGKIVDMRTISYMTGKPTHELETKDAEEIYDLIVKTYKSKMRQPKVDMKDISQKAQSDAERYGGWGHQSPDTSLGKEKEIEPGDGDKIGKQEEGEGNVIQKGSPDVYRKDPTTGETKYDVQSAMNKARVHAEMAGKGIGSLPASLARIVEKLTKSQVDWRSMLRTYLQRGLGSLVVSSWQVPSRRWGEMYPGTKMVTNPSVWCLVDTSGSITDKQLEQFLSEVYAISKTYKTTVHVMPFDADAYEILSARNPSEVATKVAAKMQGGGGTEIKPAIAHLLRERKFKTKDAVVIMSDGHIRDLNNVEVKDMMNRLANNASVFIFLTSDRPGSELRPLLPIQTKILEVKS